MYFIYKLPIIFFKINVCLLKFKAFLTIFLKNKSVFVIIIGIISVNPCQLIQLA